jgi:GTP-binding protein
MRREGYELAVSRPEVILREVDGVTEEPYEALVADVDEQHQGNVMGRLGERKAVLQNLDPDGKGRVRMEFIIPARGLIGFQTEFKTITSGTGMLFHVFDHYGPRSDADIGQRSNGVLISNATGSSPAYAQIAMQERGRLFIEPGEEIYEGQVIGINSKDNDLTVNALRGKQLTNFRATGKDDDEGLVPPIRFSLEQALEFIDDDELVEVTPNQIRLRKKHRTEVDRKRASRSS